MNGDRELLIFRVQLTTSRIGNLTRLIHTLLKGMTMHTLPPILSTCPRHTNCGCRERWVHMNWSMVTCKSSTRYWNYFEDYWPCAGELSAANAIGTQLRDPITSELTKWRMAVKLNRRRRGNWEKSVSKHQAQAECGE